MSAHLSCTGGVRACVCRGARCPLYPHTSSIRCCASTAWAESYPAHHTEAWRTRVSPASETPADTYSEPRQLRETRARVCYTEIWTDQCVCVCVCVCVSVAPDSGELFTSSSMSTSSGRLLIGSCILFGISLEAFHRTWRFRWCDIFRMFMIYRSL